MNPNGPIENPDLRALLNAHRDEVFASLNCHQLGTITAFDATKQTATVKINARRVVYDKPQTENGVLQQQPRLLDYPLLTDVPVFVASGGHARITLPVTDGDTCLVLFNDRDIDAWWSTGAIAAPNSSRMHSLSDALALVGFRSQANKIANYPEGEAQFRLGDSYLTIKEDGMITIVNETTGAKIHLSPDDTVLGLSGSGAKWELNPDGSLVLTGGEGGTVTIAATGAITIAGAAGGSVSITADGEVDLLAVSGARLALKVDGTGVLNDGGAKVIVNPDGTTRVESADGAYLNLSALVKIANGAGSLKTALDAVVTALTALNAKTGPSAAVQIAAAASAISDVLE